MCGLFLTGAEASQAGLGEFFKKVGRTLSKPQPTRRPVRHSSHRRTTSNSKSKTRTTSAPQTAQPPGQAAEPAEEESQLQMAPVNLTTPAPEQTPVRVASSLQPGGARRRDIPYGIPVPNRPGFVTSPYAPNQGLVDVRGFPSGMEVKDPYTSKVFLTP